MITALQNILDEVETSLTGELDVARVARSSGTTEYHLRRMFSTLAGMPLSEYVRRRRMSRAAADLLAGELTLTVATRYGYGSTEAFGRAFRAVHGAAPAEVRRTGGPLRIQPHLRFHLTVDGRTPMDTRILTRPAFRLIGHAARVPLQYAGANPHIQAHIASIPAAEHARLKTLSATEPAGLLQVTAELEADAEEGTLLTYVHGVAVPADAPLPADLDVIDVPAGDWAVFRASGAYPEVLQETWAATATDWFPSQPWRARPAPSIVAILDRADDFSTATCELWLAVERN